MPNGLIAAAVRGDRRARDELLALIQPLVLGYCRARLGRQESVLGSADDVAQEVCVAVVSAPAKAVVSLDLVRLGRCAAGEWS